MQTLPFKGGENMAKNEPIVETHISRSEDKKWVIHKTVITDLKPVGYYQKVLEDKEGQAAVA